jgi:hypothetical protein
VLPGIGPRPFPPATPAAHFDKFRVVQGEGGEEKEGGELQGSRESGTQIAMVLHQKPGTPIAVVSGGDATVVSNNVNDVVDSRPAGGDGTISISNSNSNSKSRMAKFEDPVATVLDNKPTAGKRTEMHGEEHKSRVHVNGKLDDSQEDGLEDRKKRREAETLEGKPEGNVAKSKEEEERLQGVEKGGKEKEGSMGDAGLREATHPQRSEQRTGGSIAKAGRSPVPGVLHARTGHASRLSSFPTPTAAPDSTIATPHATVKTSLSPARFNDTLTSASPSRRSPSPARQSAIVTSVTLHPLTPTKSVTTTSSLPQRHGALPSIPVTSPFKPGSKMAGGVLESPGSKKEVAATVVVSGSLPALSATIAATIVSSPSLSPAATTSSTIPHGLPVTLAPVTLRLKAKDKSQDEKRQTTAKQAPTRYM